jgi:hypothetical protein
VNWPPDFLKNLATANYGMWNSPTPGLTLDGKVQPGEGGVDIGVPIGTKVYALATGPIVAAGYWKDNAHGVITQRVNVPGADIQDLYYQHIQLDPSIKQCENNCLQLVQKGQLIGTIGPFNEIEMGFNSYWGGPWGGTWGSQGSHPGPWIRDPRPWITALATGNPSPVGSTGSASTTTGGIFPDMATITQYGEYIGIFLLAVAFVIIGVVLLGGNPVGAMAAPVNAIKSRREALK